MTDSTAGLSNTYSPSRRTAVVFAGTGTAGAYHAGVLRALTEAGIKIDLVAGCGAGAATAVFAAVDGGARLWQSDGVWRAPGVERLYGWRPALRAVAVLLALAAASLVVPLLVAAAGLLIFPVEFLIQLFGVPALGLGRGYAGVLSWAFEPAVLPTILPRVAVIGLAGSAAVLLGAAWLAGVRGRRRPGSAVSFWWTLIASPLDGARMASRVRDSLWTLMSGLPGRQAADGVECSRRYAELLAENLGQPGFRELLLLVHDLDARRDLVFAMLRPGERDGFFDDAPGRAGESFDLSGVARDSLLDALLGALALPVATEARLVTFAPDGPWRGETHRLAPRPGIVTRLLEEVRRAGATQVVLVTGGTELGAPHALTNRARDARGHLGEYLASADRAAARDAAVQWGSRFECFFEIRPGHNPLDALDFGGQFDARSDRHHSVREVIERGYEDAYRLFIDPVVAAGGEALEALEASRAAGSKAAHAAPKRQSPWQTR